MEKYTPAHCIAREMVSGHYEIAENDTGRRIGTIDKDINPAVFAAAPELLEALRECVTVPESYCMQGESSRDEAERLYRRINAINTAARAAIARATGEV